jgi:hypothetical protein
MTDQVQPPTAPANRLLFNMSGVKMGSLDRDADGTRSARWHEFSASRNFSTPDRKSVRRSRRPRKLLIPPLFNCACPQSAIAGRISRPVFGANRNLAERAAALPRRLRLHAQDKRVGEPLKALKNRST